VPKLSRVAVLRYLNTYEDAARRQIEAAARALKLEVMDFPVSHAQVRRDPVVVEPNRAEVVALAASRRLPAVYSFRQFPDSGGLMSYGANVRDIHRRSAAFVDKILKGAKPGDLPVEQPTKFELVINLKTAKALGLTIPPSVLGRADEVIQ